MEVLIPLACVAVLVAVVLFARARMKTQKPGDGGTFGGINRDNKR